MSAFITEWNMPAASFTLPLQSGYTYNMVVDWGDGSPTSTVLAYNDANATHVYTTAGTYQISITGTCGSWYINSISAIKGLITKVIQWGDVGFTGLGLVSAFRGVSTNIELPEGPLTGATGCTSIQSMFSGSKLLAIPDGFLDEMPNLTSAISFCDSNTVLQYIPQYLFRNNPLCTNYVNAFRECRSAVLNKWIFFAEGEENTRFATVGTYINLSYVFQRSYYYAASPGFAPELWNCNFGTSNVNKIYCYSGNGNKIESLTNYCSIPIEWGANKTNCPVLESIGAAWHSATQEKISITTTEAPAETDTFNCYVSTSETGLVSPENLVAITQVSDTIYEAIATIESDATEYFVYIEYSNGVTPEYLEYSDRHFTINQITTTVINITDSNNYINFFGTNEAHKYNHGLLFYNGYIFGTARNSVPVENSLFKVLANDYSSFSQIKIFLNQNTSQYIIVDIDQIVECYGFLWMIGIYSDAVLIRLNPDDLTYIVFNIATLVAPGEWINQPIGTDGDFLYFSGSSYTFKINPSELILENSFYGYDGSTSVNLPPSSILSSCLNTQVHPTIKAYCHSILIDSTHIYLAFTSKIYSSYYNGYDYDTDNYIFSFQKINKETMSHSGYVVIPRCTDDMVQNAEYIFLSPELNESIYPTQFDNWGFLAIRKTDLQIKHLNALHSDYYGLNQSIRRTFGSFVFNNLVSVLLVDSKKTVIINLDTIEQWNDNFPIGGATERIYKFQINGVDVALSPNELVLDTTTQWVHINTWGVETQLFKFPLSGIIDTNYNVLTLSNTNASALLEIINELFGCSIRCVQDAPGEADGTTGTATDADGNTYDTIVINEKRWFKQNLKTTKYRNGDTIPEVSGASEWAALSDGARCEYTE